MSSINNFRRSTKAPTEISHLIGKHTKIASALHQTLRVKEPQLNACIAQQLKLYEAEQRDLSALIREVAEVGLKFTDYFNRYRKVTDIRVSWDDEVTGN